MIIKGLRISRHLWQSFAILFGVNFTIFSILVLKVYSVPNYDPSLWFIILIPCLFFASWIGMSAVFINFVAKNKKLRAESIRVYLENKMYKLNKKKYSFTLEINSEMSDEDIMSKVEEKRKFVESLLEEAPSQKTEQEIKKDFLDQGLEVVETKTANGGFSISLKEVEK